MNPSQNPTETTGYLLGWHERFKPWCASKKPRYVTCLHASTTAADYFPLQNKALANLDMWRDKLVLDGRPDAHEVARSDFQIMWNYRLTQAIDRLVAFHAATERLPLKGLAQVHLHCKKLFEAEVRWTEKQLWRRRNLRC